MKYRKKPVVIEAWDIADLLGYAEHDWQGMPEAVTVEYDRCGLLFTHDKLEIMTIEGWTVAGKDSMLIQGIEGEFYPCRKDIFAATYEPEEQDHE